MSRMITCALIAQDDRIKHGYGCALGSVNMQLQDPDLISM